MSLLGDSKKREEKAQQQQAEELVKIADEVIDLLKTKDLDVWKVKTIHSLLGQRLTQQINDFVDKHKLQEVL